MLFLVCYCSPETREIECGEIKAPLIAHAEEFLPAELWRDLAKLVVFCISKKSIEL